ncbi:MAG: hypothetical protein ACTHOC_09130 [Luteimonas sp.]
MSLHAPLRWLLFAIALLLGASPGRASPACDGIPWKFGMTPAQVRAIDQCGPYRAFSNGDLETYEAVFDGEKRNFQFFFQPGGTLRRIGIYLYEGTDADAAGAQWAKLDLAMMRMFGALQTSGTQLAGTDQASLDALAREAAETVRAGGKPQMAPFAQPSDARVFASMNHADVQGTLYYYVGLNLDAVPADGGGAPTIEPRDVPGIARFLEANPLHDSAPALRARLMQWEAAATETVDYVCPGVLAPIPEDAIPNSAELLGQFLFGSAANQAAHPELKGELLPNQLAGMRSMLLAYAGFLAADPKARIPRLDELAGKEAQGQLAAYLEPIVLKECKDGG